MIKKEAYIKVSKSQKQIFLISILPKNEQKSSILVYQAIKIEDFLGFFKELRNGILLPKLF